MKIQKSIVLIAASIVVGCIAVFYGLKTKSRQESSPAVSSLQEKGAFKKSGVKAAERAKKADEQLGQAKKDYKIERKKESRVPVSSSKPARAKKDVDVDAFPDDEDMTPNERSLVRRVRRALEADDEKAIIACAAEAAKSKNSEVRSGMVSALQWCGRSAMAELTMFMADPDDDVRSEALDAWTDALQEIESPTAKRDLLISSMSILTDTEALEGLATEITELPNSYRIDVLTTLIENGTSQAAAVAREEYEDLTEEAYTNKEAANKWLQENPDDEVDVEDVIEKDKAEGVATPVTE